MPNHEQMRNHERTSEHNKSVVAQMKVQEFTARREGEDFLETSTASPDGATYVLYIYFASWMHPMKHACPLSIVKSEFQGYNGKNARPESASCCLRAAVDQRSRQPEGSRRRSGADIFARSPKSGVSF